jgi:CheY-like chemotaxis protein
VTPARPRVLVVEDDAQLAHLYCDALGLRGIDCAKVTDGASALRSIEQQRPALILLDLNLPTVNGWAVLEHLADNLAIGNIPVIVVTDVEPKPALDHASLVLCKPCEPDYVAKMVAEHMLAPRP